MGITVPNQIQNSYYEGWVNILWVMYIKLLISDLEAIVGWRENLGQCSLLSILWCWFRCLFPGFFEFSFCATLYFFFLFRLGSMSVDVFWWNFIFFFMKILCPSFWLSLHPLSLLERVSQFFWSNIILFLKIKALEHIILYIYFQRLKTQKYFFSD